jgi:hypothetical protein
MNDEHQISISIGDSAAQAPALTRPLHGLELASFSEPALERLRAGETLRLSWGLALLLQELDDFDDDPERTHERLLPDWLSEDDVELLLEAIAGFALPKRTSLRLHLRARNVAGRGNYSLLTHWETPGGKKLRAKPTIDGGFIDIEGGPRRRLSYAQYEVLNAIAALPPMGTNREHDLLATERVRARIPAGDSTVVLSSALARESAVEVDRVAPRIVPVGGGYSLRPHAEGVDDAKLDDYYYDTPESQIGTRIWPTEDAEGKRQRVIFSERATAALRDTRARHNLRKEDLARALSRPEEFFGPNIDTSELSDRVVGFGVPVHRVIPTFNEEPHGGWWDWDVGVTLQSEVSEPSGTLDAQPEDDAPAFSLKDPEVREQLATSIAQADEAGDVYIANPVDEGVLCITPELRRAVESAERLAEASRETEGKLAKQPKLVLQVHENLDALVFDRAELAPPEPPATFERPTGLRDDIELLPHQCEGIAWLSALCPAENGAQAHWRGCLLADDMGLGKTLQVLSFLAARRRHIAEGPHLIVAPVALLVNWRDEAFKFFDQHLDPIYVVAGSEMPSNSGEAKALLERYFLVLVSYETLRRHEVAFARVRWDTVTLDEAQKAKNPGTQVARVVRTLDARFRIALSGTPVENNLRELWTLYDWAVPGLLGSLREFGASYIKPLNTADHEMQRELAERLQQTIEPVFVRRMKQDALGDKLPPLVEYDHVVGLSELQAERYSKVLAERERGAAPLGLLIRLFSVCGHPDMDADSGQLRPLSKVRFPKADKLIELLDEIRRRDEKALIFANRRRIQRWLSAELGARYGLRVLVINGQVTSSAARMQSVERFSAKSGFNVLVLAPRAAGLGLNITAANHVIHYSREWNPAIEKQATDRAYRIGQERPVNVHTITCTSESGTTVEQRLAALLAEKRQLMNDFVVPMGGFEVAQRDLLAAMAPATARPREAAAPRSAPPPASHQPPPVAVPSVAPPPPSTPPAPAIPMPAWTTELPDDGTRQVFAHLDAHGSITEEQVGRLLGSPRKQRRFAGKLEEFCSHAPFAVQVDSANLTKRYVRKPK